MAANIRQLMFGSGEIWARPLVDSNGNAIANPTPVKLGGIQSATIDIQYDTKPLYGQQNFPIAIGRGKGKATGKAQSAMINGLLLNTVLFGQSLTTGQYAAYSDLTGQVIPATPFQITVAPPGSGVYSEDLGVRYVSSGLPLMRVSASPATGQYTVNETTGQYTFAAADTGLSVYIDYRYSLTTGVNIAVANLSMGAAPSFELHFASQYQGNACVIKFGNCTSTKFQIATKLDDFNIPEFDFEAFSDGTNICTMSFAG